MVRFWDRELVMLIMSLNSGIDLFLFENYMVYLSNFKIEIDLFLITSWYITKIKQDRIPLEHYVYKIIIYIYIYEQNVFYLSIFRVSLLILTETE